MSWQAMQLVRAFGTDKGPSLFRDIFKTRTTSEMLRAHIENPDTPWDPEHGPAPVSQPEAQRHLLEEERKSQHKAIGRFSSKRNILAALADRHYPGKPLRVSHNAIASTTGYSVSTVQRAFGWLDKVGLALHGPHHDARGRRSCNQYFINFDGLPRREFAKIIAEEVETARKTRLFRRGRGRSTAAAPGKPPTGQNDRKEACGLLTNVLPPTDQCGGDHYVKTDSPTEREDGGALFPGTAQAEETLGLEWTLADEDRRWTLTNIAGSTDPLVTASAERFRQKFGDVPMTAAERSDLWRRTWARSEWDFKRNAARSTRTADPLRAKRLETIHLRLYLKRGPHSWEGSTASKPRNEPEARARLAKLEIDLGSHAPPSQANQQSMSSRRAKA